MMIAHSDKGGVSSPPVIESTRRTYKHNGENRHVEVIDGRINYVYHTAGVVAFCSDIGPLYEILQDKTLSPSMHKRDRIQLRKQRGAEEINGSCFLHELAYACYRGKITSVEDWPKQLARFRKWMRSHGYEIDHADGNLLNCTVYNLSMMKAKQNRIDKRTLTAKIQLPAILFSGYYGNAYRILVLLPGIKKEWIKLRCRTARDYIESLSVIAKLNGGYGEPLYISNKKEYKRRPCATKADYLYSILGQEIIAGISEKEFKWCNGKKVRRLCGLSEK